MLPALRKSYLIWSQSQTDTYDAGSCEHGGVLELVLDVDLEVVSLGQLRIESMEILHNDTHRVTRYHRSGEGPIGKNSAAGDAVWGDDLVYDM